MKLPELKTCCCGCSLETGSLIISWIGIVMGVIVTVGSIVGLISGENAQTQGIGKFGFVFMLIYGIISVLMSIMLMVGINRRIARYVHAWVLINTIGLVLSILSAVINFIMLLTHGLIGDGFIYLITQLIGLAIGAYLVLVVHCFKKEIAGETQQA